jgi:tripartite-type tricarboxylate transporter receptor subunit TctC
MFKRLLHAMVASSVVLLPGGVLAQAYPTKPIRLIVPFAPGGTNDILGRMLATHIGQKWGQNMIVDNRPGHQGIIGTNLAVNSAPDGYTLVVISAAYTMNPVTVKMPYDSLRALDFVAKIGASFLVLSVNASLPVTSVSDLVAEAGRKPGELVIASSGGLHALRLGSLPEPVEAEIQHRSLQGRIPGHDGHHQRADPGTPRSERAGDTAPAFGQAQGPGGGHPEAHRAAARAADAR